MIIRNTLLSFSMLGALVSCKHSEHHHDAEKHGAPSASKEHHGPQEPASKSSTSRPTSRPSTAAVPVSIRMDPKSYDHFGDGVAKGTPSLSVAQLCSNSSAYDGKKVGIRGSVASVCKAKGCWMILEEGGQKLRVKFRDYSFFMPLDCEKREVVLTGTFQVKVIPVAEARHYLEDAGKHEEAKKITEPQKEFSVMADGVAMRKRAE